jgi:hypothetical protein
VNGRFQTVALGEGGSFKVPQVAHTPRRGVWRGWVGRFPYLGWEKEDLGAKNARGGDETRKKCAFSRGESPAKGLREKIFKKFVALGVPPPTPPS